MDQDPAAGWIRGRRPLKGSVYLTIFPERARAFVLDSPNTPTPDLLVETATRATGIEGAYVAFFDWCGTEGACAFHGGEGAATVQAAFESLMTSLEPAGLPVGNRLLSRLDAGKGVYPRLTNGGFPAVAADLAAAEAGDGAPLLAAADAWYVPTPGADLRTIFCLDRGETVPKEEFWSMVGDLEAGAAPHAAHDYANWWGSCRDWPYKTDPVVISAPTAPPALVVGGPSDIWTPLAFAESTVEALGNGSHLLIGDNAAHVQTDKSLCVAAVVDAFVVDPMTPPAVANCNE